MRCVLISVNFGKNKNWMKFTTQRSELIGTHRRWKLFILNVTYSMDL